MRPDESSPVRPAAAFKIPPPLRRGDDSDVWKIGAIAGGVSRDECPLLNFSVSADIEIRQSRCPATRSCQTDSFLAPGQRHHFPRGLAGTGGSARRLQPVFNRCGCRTLDSQCFQPASQFIHLRGRQLFNGILNFSNAAHASNFSTSSRSPARPGPD